MNSRSLPRRLARALPMLLLALALGPAAAAPAADSLQGRKVLTLHGRDGRAVPIGALEFAPPRADGAVAFTLEIDRAKMEDHFLSMREFKCVEGDSELLCHVPYPYKQPQTVQAGDYRWLEHALLFLYKQPRDFGAKLRNGLIFKLTPNAKGLVGTPQAVDLTVIGAPPDDLTVPPYKPALRDDVAAGERWVQRLTID